MNRNLRIDEQTYEHLGFLYRVRVTRDHSVDWDVWKPGAKEGAVAHCRTIRAERVRRKPRKAVGQAHQEARKWIEEWLNTHFALEAAMDEFADRYANTRTEFPPCRRQDRGAW